MSYQRPETMTGLRAALFRSAETEPVVNAGHGYQIRQDI